MNAPAAPLDHVRGDATGLAIPAHAGALAAGGAAFLTRAFRAYGSIAPDNAVTAITRFEPCEVGSTGTKAFLSVDYARAEPGLPRQLFAKFSRHFHDPFHDRRRFELESEIRFYELARRPGFPVTVPRALFGDFHRASGTGLLISACIPFGTGGIEPPHAKCMDHLLENPLEHYRAILRALARLAAGYQSGALSPQAEEAFPFDPDAAAAEDPIALTEAELSERIERYADFARRYPRLVPAHLAAAPFLDRLRREAPALLRRQVAIRRYLHADPAYVALSHFNANIDNAWFWRDAGGALQCGLFDWQRARPMNLGYALWGGLCGAGPAIWEGELEGLLDSFIAELHAHGGALLDRAVLARHLRLYAAAIGLAGLIDTPRLVVARMPDVALASGPLDPMFEHYEASRCFLHIFTNLLRLWEANDLLGDLAVAAAEADLIANQ